MSERHPTATPVDAWSKLLGSNSAPVVDPSKYRSLAGALQYLTLMQPDRAYTV